jgi:hypothetical protein
MIEGVDGSRNEGFKYSRSVRKPESQRGGNLGFKKPRSQRIKQLRHQVTNNQALEESRNHNLKN